MAASLPWESPLKGYENAEPLPTTINADGKSLYNPPGPQSAAYDEFPNPINPSNNAFDVHSEGDCIVAKRALTRSSLLPSQQPNANSVCKGAA